MESTSLFPFKGSIERLYASHHTAKEVTWHIRSRSKDEDLMCHLVDGKELIEFDEKHPNFERESRNMRLGLTIDGFNPFDNISLSYSICPVVMTASVVTHQRPIQDVDFVDSWSQCS